MPHALCSKAKNTKPKNHEDTLYIHSHLIPVTIIPRDGVTFSQMRSKLEVLNTLKLQVRISAQVASKADALDSTTERQHSLAVLYRTLHGSES